MKKLIVVLTLGVLTGSVFAAEKPVAAPAAKAVKAAACCTTDGSCKTGAQKAGCADCKKAGAACTACKGKAACAPDKAASCPGGVCPLKK